MISKLKSLLAAAALVVCAGQARAAVDPAASALVELVRPLLLPPSAELSPPGWDQIEADRAIRWTPGGPTMTNSPSPDGNYFARIGQTAFAGKPMMVVATGARSMVFSYYFRSAGPPIPTEAIADGFRQAGFTVSPARCAMNPAQPSARAWYRLAQARTRPAYLYAGPLGGGASQGYILYLDKLPPMTQAEAGAYTDTCGGKTSPGGSAPGARRIANGQTGVVAVIEALLRPVGQPQALPWTSLSSIPGIVWNRPPAMKMASPYSEGGVDLNPRLLEGRFNTPTTEMNAIATGDDRAANHFSLMNGGNLPRNAVFDGLMRDGYAIAPIRCGKPYTQMSDAWFRISSPGKQPAILYRAMYEDGGRTTETYVLRLDNLMPPIQPGQTPAPPGGCRG